MITQVPDENNSKQRTVFIIHQVIKAMNGKITAFWNVTTCILVGRWVGGWVGR
jgi:hypothetical protein